MIFKYILYLNINKKGGINMAFLSTVLATVGSFIATLGSQACFWVIIDEPECPKSLVK